MLVLIIIISQSALGQIANIESKRKTTKEEGLAGDIELNFIYVKNVDEVLQYGGKINAFYFNKRHSLMLLLETSLIQAEKQDLAQNNFEHLRYNFALGKRKRVIFEIFEQLQQNRVQDIDLRLLTGSGLRFSLSDKTDTLVTNLGISGMFEYERSTNGENIEENIRANTYLSLQYAMTDDLEIGLIGYYQPLFVNFRDYRLSSELALKFDIIKTLAFKVRVNFVYDSRPLPGIPNDIINITNGLSYSF